MMTTTTTNEGVYMTIHLFLINAIYQMGNDESDSKDEDDDKIYNSHTHTHTRTLAYGAAPHHHLTHVHIPKPTNVLL